MYTQTANEEEKGEVKGAIHNLLTKMAGEERSQCLYGSLVEVISRLHSSFGLTFPSQLLLSCARNSHNY